MISFLCYIYFVRNSLSCKLHYFDLLYTFKVFQMCNRKIEWAHCRKVLNLTVKESRKILKFGGNEVYCSVSLTEITLRKYWSKICKSRYQSLLALSNFVQFLKFVSYILPLIVCKQIFAYDLALSFAHFIILMWGWRTSWILTSE